MARGHSRAILIVMFHGVSHSSAGESCAAQVPGDHADASRSISDQQLDPRKGKRPHTVTQGLAMLGSRTSTAL